MINPPFDDIWCHPPSKDEAEITVYGTGYGESIVIHSGNGNWIVVDSACLGGKNNPFALRYLKILGVDFAAQVSHVVATHWDNDHIRGIAKIVRECENCCFVNSATVHTEKMFVELLAMSQGMGKKLSRPSEILEAYYLARERYNTSHRPTLD